MDLLLLDGSTISLNQLRGHRIAPIKNLTGVVAHYIRYIWQQSNKKSPKWLNLLYSHIHCKFLYSIDVIVVIETISIGSRFIDISKALSNSYIIWGYFWYRYEIEAIGGVRSQNGLPLYK